jgi:hypothetical protein
VRKMPSQLRVISARASSVMMLWARPAASNHPHAYGRQLADLQLHLRSQRQPHRADRSAKWAQRNHYLHLR